MNTNQAPATLQAIELAELPTNQAQGTSLLNGNLDVIQNVKVKLSVRVGETVVSVGELMQMKNNHVLKLDALLDAPVDILLEGNVVARGQLLAVDDNFGVKITELPKPATP